MAELFVCQMFLLSPSGNWLHRPKPVMIADWPQPFFIHHSDSWWKEHSAALIADVWLKYLKVLLCMICFIPVVPSLSLLFFHSSNTTDLVSGKAFCPWLIIYDEWSWPSTLEGHMNVVQLQFGAAWLTCVCSFTFFGICVNLCQWIQLTCCTA